MRSLLIILSRPSHEAWAQELAAALDVASPVILVSTPLEAAHYIAQHQFSPSHVVLDIGARGVDILTEIDALAHQCEAGTRVIAVGDSSDSALYREIINCGVTDYKTMPVAIAALVHAFSVPPVPVTAAASAPTPATPTPVAPATSSVAADKKRVIAFMGAASGDGASTAALNTAYALSQLGSTILVDMDYQFGMIAKQLGLQNQYGIADIVEHPNRGIDATLIQRMVTTYGKLHVITSPSNLRVMPSIQAETMQSLIAVLRANYDYVILDLPHTWMPWVSTTIAQSTHVVVVAQRWLKSVAHASRILRAIREAGLPAERVHVVINRSGTKFKEAVEIKDFERVCNVVIHHSLSNDIHSVVAAETSAKTLMELPPCALASDIERMAFELAGRDSARRELAPPKRAGLFSKRSG
jgi:pilus assembly protein CpaE